MTQMILFDYSQLLRQVKQRVLQAQQRAIYAANEELLRMYWDIGEMISLAQKLEGWGNGTLERLATDINNLYPEVKGFSPRNCRFMIQFFEEYNKELTMVKSITHHPLRNWKQIRNHWFHNYPSITLSCQSNTCHGHIIFSSSSRSKTSAPATGI